jgi:hypothetical protein
MQEVIIRINVIGAARHNDTIKCSTGLRTIN